MPGRMVTGLVSSAALVFSAALASVGPALGMEPKWPSGPYKYLVIDQDIKGVVVEFGRNAGMPVDVSDQVKGRLRGQVATATATAREFLDNLCDSSNLVWYFDGAVLHVDAKAEIRTELVNLGRFSPEEASEKLTALGVADARFPVRTTDNASVISVSGPPKFVSMVRQALRPPPPAQEDPRGDEVKVRVFRGGALAVPPEKSVASRAKSRG
jgi:type II secretory pathway component GspD/PulD (secretin)